MAWCNTVSCERKSKSKSESLLWAYHSLAQAAQHAKLSSEFVTRPFPTISPRTLWRGRGLTTSTRLADTSRSFFLPQLVFSLVRSLAGSLGLLSCDALAVRGFAAALRPTALHHPACAHPGGRSKPWRPRPTTTRSLRHRTGLAQEYSAELVRVRGATASARPRRRPQGQVAQARPLQGPGRGRGDSTVLTVAQTARSVRRRRRVGRLVNRRGRKPPNRNGTR